MFFLKSQIKQVRHYGVKAYFCRKFSIFVTKKFIFRSFFYFFAVPMVVVIRLIRPLILVRFGLLISDRIGHFAANTELYLCERDAGINLPHQKYFVDIFSPRYVFRTRYRPISNRQLLLMWKRVLYIFPEFVLTPIKMINRFLPGWEIHEIIREQTDDRDVRNLFIRYPVHLKFLGKEEKRGAEELKKIGIPKGAPFVCLLVRDDAYLKTQFGGDWSHHNYRDADIDNYILATEELVKRGYYVIRMGAVVRKPLKVNNPHVIDYAWNGMRTEFMDIYLGATCDFCISTHSGWDAIPNIFRKPMVFTNLARLGEMFTFRKNFITIPKKYKDVDNNRILSLKEIFSRDLGYFHSISSFRDNGIELVENTQEEIRDVAVEMVERIKNTWQNTKEDEELQARFWKLFPTDVVGSNGLPLHGEICGRLGTNYLRSNKEWLE